MEISYDASVDAAYIYLDAAAAAERDVQFTYACDPKEVGGMIHLDFDRNGTLRGIEVLDASRLLPKDLLDGASSD